jgi:Holliday junction DNA helicase RuvA
MIARLAGTLREKTPARVVIDVSGVGYEVYIPLSTFTELPDEGKTVALRVHTHVREDAILLYGFQTARERAVFDLLLRTSGVGPKLALTVLSGLATDRLVAAIARGDVAALRSVPGVGQKTAERIVVELRDRAADLAETPDDGAPPRRLPIRGTAGDMEEQALSALLNLGYTRAQAQRVVEEAATEAGPGVALESLLRAALRRLSR